VWNDSRLRIAVQYGKLRIAEIELNLLADLGEILHLDSVFVSGKILSIV
jgi:hypothetical protein